MGGKVPGWGEARRTRDQEEPPLWFTWGLAESVFIAAKASRSPARLLEVGDCPERISDLSENLRELGLDGVLVSEELRAGQAGCAGVARRLWEPGGGATVSPWGIFPGYIRTAWELYKILVGSWHPHPLR